MRKLIRLILVSFLIISCNACLASTSTLFIEGEIKGGESLRQIQHDLTYITFNNECRGEKLTDLVVVIISPGGSVVESIAIYDYLRAIHKMDVKIHTVASGYCMSGGMIILQAGDIRYATAYTQLMTHSPWAILTEDTGLNKTKASELVSSLDKTNDRLIQIFADRTGIKKERLAKYFIDQENYMSAIEAYQIGFVDKVIYSAKEMTLYNK